jgi:HAD superfamily hydrolase (TIGR01509 family)
MIKAIIFDCYGVLVQDALGIILTDLKKTDPETADKIITIVNEVIEGNIDVREYRSRAAALLDMSTEDYVKKLHFGQVKNVELLKYIEQLRKKYKIGMLSNVAKGGLPKLFTEDELTRCFDVVVGSGDIGFAKPDTQAYKITADRLEVHLDECVMIDDQDDYCEGAKRVDMKAIKYISFQQMQQALADIAES